MIVFSGGGTGGHVYPGLAVAKRVKQLSPNCEIVWIGSRTGMEKKIVEDAGLVFIGISAGKLRRYISIKNAIDIFKIFAGFIQAYFILKKIKPCLIFSKGGYVSVPPVFAAKMLRITVITHESDYDPGLATKINSRFADSVLIPYKDSLGFYEQTSERRVIVTGNPVREDLAEGDRVSGLRLLGVIGNKPLLVVIGGSQGASKINSIISDILGALLLDWDVVHQMGEREYESSSMPGYRTFDYFRSEYPHVVAAADLIVCRAGASTIWEVAYFGKPMILIPIGLDASRGDQIENARFFERRGAARVLWGEGQPRDLSSRLQHMIHTLRKEPEIRSALGKGAQEVCCADGTRAVASIITGILQGAEA